MSHLNKGKAKYILVLALILLLFTITLYGSADGFYNKDFHSYLTTDTIPVKTINAATIDSSKNKNQAVVADSFNRNKIADTNIVVKTDTFSFKTSKEALDAPVVYHADDSMVMYIPEKKIILYGKKPR